MVCVQQEARAGLAGQSLHRRGGSKRERAAWGKGGPMGTMPPPGRFGEGTLGHQTEATQEATSGSAILGTGQPFSKSGASLQEYDPHSQETFATNEAAASNRASTFRSEETSYSCRHNKHHLPSTALPEHRLGLHVGSRPAPCPAPAGGQLSEIPSVPPPAPPAARRLRHQRGAETTASPRPGPPGHSPVPAVGFFFPRKKHLSVYVRS